MSYEAEILADTPVLYLRLDEIGLDNNGDIFPDSSGNGLDATQQYNNGATAPARGFPSPIETDPDSTEFRGWGDGGGSPPRNNGSSHLSVANNSLLQIAGDFTVEEWLRPEDGGPSVPGVHYIMAGKNAGDGGSYGIGLYGAFSEITGFVKDSGDNRWGVFSGVNINTPGFFGTSRYVVVRLISGLLQIFINGVFVAQTTITSGLGPVISDDPFVIESGTGGYLQNRHDEVAVYSHALSAERILAHYEAAFNENPLVGRADLHLIAKLNGETAPATLVFPFRHNWATPARETLEWSTDVMPAEQDYEQRAAVRQRPRRTLEYDSLIANNDIRRRFRAFLFRNQGNAIYLPVWTDICNLESDAAASSTTLNFDSIDCDFEDSGRLLLFQDETTFEMCAIDTVGDNSSTLLAATASDWKQGTIVVPLRRALVDSTAQISMLTGSVEQTQLSYRLLAQDVALEPRRNGTYAPRYTYREVEVFDPAILGGNNWRDAAKGESSIRAIEPETPGGIFSRDPQDTAARDLMSHSILLSSRPAIVRFLAWAFIRQGRRVPLWAPTLREDFTAVSVATITGGSTLTVAGHEYTDFYQTHSARRDIALVYNDGTMAFRRISKAATAGDNDLLTFTGQSAPSLTNLYLVCFLKFARLNEDTLTLVWHTAAVAEVTVNFFDLLTTPV